VAGGAGVQEGGSRAETKYVEISQSREGNRMAVKPPIRPAPQGLFAADPSPSADAPRRGSLRWVRNVLGRSIRLEQRHNQLHLALVDPNRPADADKPLSPLMQQRAELGARLLVHDPATQAVRHLFVVHDELRNGGWPSVEALPGKVVERALIEAEILAVDEPSPLFESIVDTLRDIKTAADARAAKDALDAEWEVPQAPEVSDTNFDEYELTERSWAGTVPAGLDLRGGGDSRM
jgi:hypothetical protein